MIRWLPLLVLAWAGMAFSASLDVKVKYRCKWWSTAQMEGLDPNNPPPKETEVELKKWEYSDPVGVPHPDTFEAVAVVTNNGKNDIKDLKLETESRWKVGPLKNSKKAVWQKPENDSKTETLKPGESKEVVVKTFAFKDLMESLHAKAQWAWRLKVTVNGVSKEAKGKGSAELPITPGD